MSDSFSLVQLASAIQHNIPKEDVSSSQLISTGQDLGFIERSKERRALAKEIRLVQKELWSNSRANLQMAIDYREDQAKLALTIKNAKDSKDSADRTRVANQAKDVARKLGKLTDAMSLPNDRLQVIIERETRPSISAGVAPLQAYIDYLNEPDPLASPEEIIEFREARNTFAFENVLKDLNDQSLERYGEPIFDLTPDGEIKNLDEIFDQDKSPLARFGLRTPTEIEQNLLAFDQNIFKRYNNYRKQHNDAFNELRLAQADIDMKANSLADPGNQDWMGDLDSIAGKLDALQGIATEGVGIDVDDANQLYDDLKGQEALEATRDRLQKDFEKLENLSPKKYDDATEELALATTSSSYRAWAADHGFTELGRVDVDENNVADISTYVQGRDDLAARRAFEREQERGEGRYGFRNIGTGDIVRVTLDGVVYEGERLKYHAYDPPGTMRITQPEGEPLLITPDKVDEVQLIDSIPDRASPLSLRSQRRHRRVESKIMSAIGGVRGESPVSEDDAASNDDGYIMENGRHLSQDEYNERVNDEVAKRSVTARTFEDQDYLVTADEQVFQLEDNQDGTVNLKPIMAEPDLPPGEADLYSKVLGSSVRRAVAFDGDEPRPITADDIKSQKFSPGIEQFEGEDFFDPEDEAVFAAVDATQRASITPQALNMEVSTDEFDASAGAEMGEVMNVGGLKIRRVVAPPKSPAQKKEEAEPEERDPTPPSADPLPTEKDVEEDVVAAAEKPEKPPVEPVKQDPKAVEAMQALANEKLWNETSGALYQKAIQARTLNEPDADKLAKQYYRLAAKTGQQPLAIRKMTREEFETAKESKMDALAGQPGSFKTIKELGQDAKRQQIMGVVKEPPPDEAADKLPKSVVVPGQQGVPEGVPVGGLSPDQQEKIRETVNGLNGVNNGD
jgi:hypothetical protein